MDLPPFLVEFLQALAAGVTVGGAYALMCIGLGIIFGSMSTAPIASPGASASVSPPLRAVPIGELTVGYARDDRFRHRDATPPTAGFATAACECRSASSPDLAPMPM